ncbi:MAG: FeoA domain-containing protein [Desulfurococcales archaeon]|nr:FeoA domain-containing protein [Desulfurococcales archaeon]
MKGTYSGFWGGYGRGRGWGGKGSSSNLPPNDPVLERVPAGRKVRVKYILGGWNANSRLASMGIVQGAEIEVLKNDLNYPWTPIIVKVNSVEIALGRGIASRVVVEYIE